MCGIAGIFTTNPENLSRINAMVSAMPHRGPDDNGTWQSSDNTLALGQTRLAIIAPTAEGKQPLHDHTGRYSIVFNGEIYNYRELREMLRSLGHTFRTDTDTEVIIEAYKQWGTACVKQLRGMFAFALFDSKASADAPRLFLARDRLGIKPLLYSRQQGSLLFASELKALTASGLVGRTAHTDALADFLRRGAITQPQSILENVLMLPAGHTAALRAPTDAITPECYWRLGSEQPALPDSYSDIVTLVRSRLDDAVRAHLVSDVPVGAFLSGGIDSTAIVALMARQTQHPVETFSLGFSSKGEVHDERNVAAEAAAVMGCTHRALEITEDDLKNAFPNLIQSLDSPSVDGFNTYFVSRLAAQHVKVALSGLGGDELFGGYGFFKPKPGAALVSPFLGAVNRVAALLPSPLNDKIRRRLSAWNAHGVERLSLARLFNSDESLHQLLSFPFNSDAALESSPSAIDDFQRVSAAELNGYLRNTLLRDGDVMSMAHSLEVRPILLDHLFVETVYAIPAWAKQHGAGAKPLFIDAVRDVLPETVLSRPKRGFDMPFAHWMNAPLHEHALSAFNSKAAAQLLKNNTARRFQNAAKTKTLTRAHWPWFILLSWLEQTQVRCD